MRVRGLRTSILLAAALLCRAQGRHLPDVLDRSLSNGIKVLVVERPGTGAVRAGVFIQGGRCATGALSPAAADLLVRSLFRRMPPAGQDLELPLRQEEAAWEDLRLEHLRQTRRPDRAPTAELPSLQAMQATALKAIQAKLAPSDAWDGVDALGGTRRAWEATADYMAYGVDLPAASLKAWFQVQAAQLARPDLCRFPLERERFLQELDAGEPPVAPSLSVLLSMALAGRPYAQASEFQRADVEALTRADLANLAHGLFVPSRLTLVLVGDLEAAAVLPDLERTFGSLGKGAAPAGPAPFRDDDPSSALDSPAGRRMQVSTSGETRVLMAWRVPRANHPDGPILQVLAQILAGSPGSRLNQALVTTRPLARRLTLELGVPGERDANLLVINAEPAPGHSLAELTQAIEGEVLRLQREPLPETELNRARNQLEARQILLQEDGATLVAALGAAHCQSGDWRTAFRAPTLGRELRVTDIQGAARTYLVPARMTVAQFGPDPLLLPMDRTEARLLQALTALVRRRMEDPIQAQDILREAIRQLRMLSTAEREQTLKLLEAQVAP
ncbi:MAG TPA: insulinase family protein [Holophaga sp.]|nr:insulinase family protein [Holophaga sp.]